MNTAINLESELARLRAENAELKTSAKYWNDRFEAMRAFNAQLEATIAELTAALRGIEHNFGVSESVREIARAALAKVQS